MLSDVWVSTFHSFCARLLRREAVNAGLPRDFAIFDDDDQTAAVKRTLMQLDLPADDYPPRSMRAQISHAKNHGITPEEMEASAEIARDEERKEVAKVFRAYNEMLRKASALDFDDLLLRAVELLQQKGGCAGGVELALSIFDGGRISGHKCGAGRVGALAGGHAEECLRCGRRRPIDLQLARGACGESETLHRGFPRGEDYSTRGELPLDANNSGCGSSGRPK